ncbi:helix-turn-helix transcriptional regulator [Patescibacteria group bacterium]|nr:helix-turn-helix transcriptional regulator [Patescibacteria group bacterium]
MNILTPLPIFIKLDFYSKCGSGIIHLTIKTRKGVTMGDKEPTDEIDEIIKEIQKLEQDLKSYDEELKTAGRNLIQAKKIWEKVPATVEKIHRLKRLIKRQKLLQEALKRKGVSLEDLAFAIKVSTDTINEVVLGDMPPRLNTVFDICKELGIRYDEFDK